MKTSFPAFLVVCVLAAAAASVSLLAQATMPRMTTVTPDTAKVGDTLTVEGENLQKSHVAEVYLTDGKNDVKVDVTEQTEKAIKFTVPKSAKPGRLALMILTAEQQPKLIEQPVKVTIE